LIVALIAWGVSGKQAVGLSAACGALAVIVPAALFARGVTGQFASVNAGSAVMSFFLWELVKILVTVGILLAAQRLVIGLSWPAMLVGLVVTIKVYWVALAFKRKPRPV
jgi:ATP synthase protein I